MTDSLVVFQCSNASCRNLLTANPLSDAFEDHVYCSCGEVYLVTRPYIANIKNLHSDVFDFLDDD